MKIRNKLTGEVREISAAEAPNYGLNIGQGNAAVGANVNLTGYGDPAQIALNTLGQTTSQTLTPEQIALNMSQQKMTPEQMAAQGNANIAAGVDQYGNKVENTGTITPEQVRANMAEQNVETPTRGAFKGLDPDQQKVQDTYVFLMKMGDAKTANSIAANWKNSHGYALMDLDPISAELAKADQKEQSAAETAINRANEIVLEYFNVPEEQKGALANLTTLNPKIGARVAPEATSYKSTRDTFSTGLMPLVTSGQSTRLNAVILKKLSDMLPDITQPDSYNKLELETLNSQLKATFGRGLPEETMKKIRQMGGSQSSKTKTVDDYFAEAGL